MMPFIVSLTNHFAYLMEHEGLSMELDAQPLYTVDEHGFADLVPR